MLSAISMAADHSGLPASAYPETPVKLGSHWAKLFVVGVKPPVKKPNIISDQEFFKIMVRTHKEE